MKEKEKNLELERLVFFSDAVVAIAITLLALNIKVPAAPNGHLAFGDFISEWHTFAAFVLSFLNIANFWKVHHHFFAHIRKIDDRMLWFNVLWLFFIVTLPFATSLVSTYFFDTAAIFAYSLNTLLIAMFQNNIWDYASVRPDFMKDGTIDEQQVQNIRFFCNVDMVNALLAVGLSFISPPVAFISLFTKLPMILFTGLFYRRKLRKPT